MRRVFIHVGVLCLILAVVHALVWFAHLDPDLYYAIPPLFVFYLGLVLIASAVKRMRQSRRPPQ